MSKIIPPIMRKFNYDHRMSIQHEEFDTRELIAKIQGSKCTILISETTEELELNSDDDSITESEGDPNNSSLVVGGQPKGKNISRKKRKEN